MTGGEVFLVVLLGGILLMATWLFGREWERIKQKEREMAGDYPDQAIAVNRTTQQEPRSVARTEELYALTKEIKAWLEERGVCASELCIIGSYIQDIYNRPTK